MRARERKRKRRRLKNRQFIEWLSLFTFQHEFLPYLWRIIFYHSSAKISNFWNFLTFFRCYVDLNRSTHSPISSQWQLYQESLERISNNRESFVLNRSRKRNTKKCVCVWAIATWVQLLVLNHVFLFKENCYEKCNYDAI